MHTWIIQLQHPTIWLARISIDRLCIKICTVRDPRECTDASKVASRCRSDACGSYLGYCFSVTQTLTWNYVCRSVNYIYFTIQWFCLISLRLFELPLDKTNNVAVYPAKTQMPSLIRVFAVHFQADSEDSDQTWWMPRLISVFGGHKCHFVGFVMRRLI